mmetsp:Transcript_35482/g.57400  ORF Transcript_35482/g.57400 Transcript_35482/m.57400 type:complete len:168 (+) Transcript_35482:173-676(+)
MDEDAKQAYYKRQNDRLFERKMASRASNDIAEGNVTRAQVLGWEEEEERPGEKNLEEIADISTQMCADNVEVLEDGQHFFNVCRGHTLNDGIEDFLGAARRLKYADGGDVTVGDLKYKYGSYSIEAHRVNGDITCRLILDQIRSPLDKMMRSALTKTDFSTSNSEVL